MATQAGAKIKAGDGPWELPEGWEWVPLGEICDITIGGTPSRSNSDYWGPGHTWVSIADLDGDAVTDTKEQITDLGVVGYPLSPGHFVSSMTCRDGLTTLPGHGQLVDL
jgi:type I restriction enzyme S subunit